jgi:hypothetical protein
MTDEAQTPAPARRPGGVTFVLVLTWLAALADLVLGAWLLLISFDKAIFEDEPVTADIVRYWALVALLIGTFTAIIAAALGRASQFARVLTVVIMTVRLASALWALVAIQSVTLWPAVFDAAIALLIIVLLTNRSASDYFRKRT